VAPLETSPSTLRRAETGRLNGITVNVPYEIAPSQRVLIVGRTQSGKSTLARVLSYGYRNLLVIDSKHDELVPRAAIVHSAGEFRQLYPQRTTRAVLRVDPNNLDDVDEVIGRALHYGNCRIVVHEAVDFATATRILPMLRRAAKVGASLGVGLTTCSQRPKGLHNDLIAETEHVFIFDLQLPGDREKVAGIAGEGALVRVTEPFGFLYYGPTTGGDVVRCAPLHLGAV
jgi:DNA helicase HerA-like ATPase